MHLNILYEDNHVLLLEKPSLLPTQPSYGVLSLEDHAKAMIKERDQKRGGVFLHAVHRLDSATSGIVLFAKTQKALSRLTQAFREGLCQKEYLAIVQGTPPLGEMKDFMLHDDHKAIMSPRGKEALLTICSATPMTLAKQHVNNLSLLHIVLHTGRYHQIRAQLAYHGFPVVGDRKYGSTLSFTQGIALHHHQLTFPHPTLHEKRSFSSHPFWL